MWFAMILMYIVQPNLSEGAYRPVLEQKLYSSRAECMQAGKERAEALQQDEHVKEIVLGVCLPSPDKAV